MEEMGPFVVFPKSTITKLNFYGKVLFGLAVFICLVVEAYIVLAQPRSPISSMYLSILFLFVAALGIYGLILWCIRAHDE